MPDFPIIDAHVHLWDPSRFRIAWLDGASVLDKPYGLTEYQEHSREVEIEAVVYLEVDVVPSYAFLEAQYVAARANPHLQGIVAHAPIEYGERARTYLAALRALGPRIKGVRRLLQGEADPNFCLQPDFLRGVQILPEYGFSFDICIKHHQLGAVIEMVRRSPGTSFILDHIGKPDIKGHVLDPWREQISELAALPNVVCKVSGLVTEADHQHWSVDDLVPYVSHVLEAFGEERVIFGGDWPVALLATTYTRWVETLDALTANLSPGAKRKLWVENARRFYRLSS
jgi:L-fuconolactonase